MTKQTHLQAYNVDGDKIPFAMFDDDYVCSIYDDSEYTAKLKAKSKANQVKINNHQIKIKKAQITKLKAKLLELVASVN